MFQGLNVCEPPRGIPHAAKFLHMNITENAFNGPDRLIEKVLERTVSVALKDLTYRWDRGKTFWTKKEIKRSIRTFNADKQCFKNVSSSYLERRRGAVRNGGGRTDHSKW